MGVGETATGDASAVGVTGHVGGTEFSRSWGGGAAAFLTVHTSGELMGTACKHTVTQDRGFIPTRVPQTWGTSSSLYTGGRTREGSR